MKVLVTGANGQLGYDVIKRLEEKKIEYLGTDRDTLDITNEDDVKRVIKDYSPDVIVHCAAYTAVDKAEDERELCHAVNVLGTRYIVEACKEIDAKMIYISTDYVFDGEGDKPFEVTDTPNPINYYGQTKYEGELEVQKLVDKYFIVRISWVFGSNGNNFVKTMLRLGKEIDEISVVADQVGSPTYTYDLAGLLLEMIETDKYGIYHATNEGYCSWYEFACEIFNQAGMDVKVNPIKTEDYPTRAKRPKNSRLAKEDLVRNNLKARNEWYEALRRYIDEL
ncbi:dTDP-4-dehydrorhamnose reductase [Aerococcus viridans]|uniref:dTDP-4-dehydrorhamnose reductase n=2 Tax=Aerococcus viridans TaxID=1377 RepID=A0AAU8U4B2_9LACT|nr:dTDP-4-dehydrorhamnose reductase [Aerococcus viridans]AMC01352.1 NAD(P)-dependent oxidoreductase [Aerococcus viridans]EFG50218.1 dTDP-4-dehydrorhamnose reductase [Aerococcus viridans ATCC 11563 = CCUG 4311]SUU15891.1 dTDP-4-dehydrorhamnose reductase [Aerococcus viridans]